MTTPELFRTMSRYNRWMNEKLYAVCAELTDETRKEDRHAPFGSIHGTLNHLLLADRIWMSRFTGEPPATPIRALDQELYSDFAALHRERRAEDEKILAYAAALTPEILNTTLVFRAITQPGETSLPLARALLHFFNHQTHHRGQLTTLLEQIGCDFGVTDLLWMFEA